MSTTNLYIFLDEGGNFDFSASGTRFFTLTSVAMLRPFRIAEPLDNLKYDLIDLGLNIEYFHATEDKQPVRDRVFDIIQNHLENIQIDALIVEKRKTGPALRDPLHFYPRMLGYLLKYPLQGRILGRLTVTDVEEVIIITDALPHNKKRDSFEKAVKSALKTVIPNVRYRIMHHQSRSSMELQVTDYCNWAIYRKWEKQDERSYNLVRKGIKSEFDIFRTGTTFYY